MFRRTKICTGLMLAFGGTLAIGALPAMAQDAPAQRVEITGSAVKRIDAETALPVQVLKKEDIERSGVTSTVDLLRKLPTIQGSTGESASVGGSTFGFSGVSIHNVGETRTLVLLNGHRLTLFGGQTLTGFAAGFDLNSIPVSAIERVEVLTDGASALYGADAIAGVVNFITKRDTTAGDVTVGFSSPSGGARETRIGATKGFGSLADDGFNVMLSFAHDQRTKLNAKDRPYSQTGKVYFNFEGKNYRIQQFSPSPIPANATNDNGNLISPYYMTHGVCPDKTFHVVEPLDDGSVDDYCGFDFVGELETYPERKRDSFIATFTKALGGHELSADLLLSRTTQVSRIAPVPGSISIPAGSALHNQYLLPLGITGDSLAFYRVYDLGKRTNDDKADFIDLKLGAKGTIATWDYDAVITHSESKVSSKISGYPGALAMARVRASGLLDPFVGPGQQSAAGQAALDSTNYKGYWDGGVSKLDTMGLKASHELMPMAGGSMALAAGGTFNREDFQSKPSLFAQGLLADPVLGTLCDPTGADTTRKCDQRFGDAAATVPYSAKRNSYGLFGELVMPVLKSLELSAAVRHDHYDDFGNADTAKLSFRWNPTSALLIRGSAGTGFHAPTVPQVKAALQPYGVTSGKYSCSADLAAVAAAHGAVCQPGSKQYDQFAGGNSRLQPEKSKQATLGFRFEPSPALSVGTDLWHVQIKDSFGQLNEKTVFAKPKNFANSWTTKEELGTGVTYLAFLADNQNLGNYYATGLDFDLSSRIKTRVGELSSQFTMTYMLREDQQLERDGPYYSAIGNHNDDLGVVTFRYQGRWATTLKTGNWANTIGINFKSGYKDATATAELLDSAGNPVLDPVTGLPVTEDLRYHVAFYQTVDWQTQWNFRKDMSLTLGVLNLFNRRPPLSISDGGTNRGQMFGYDDRYYDPRDRTLYANFSYKF